MLRGSSLALAGGVVLWGQKSNQQDTKQQAKKEVIKQEKTELIKKFEKFLQENGKRIKLETLDTTGWKTYIDHQRGYSFKYPPSWHVVPIDSSKFFEKSYSAESQRAEKRLRKQFPLDCNKPFKSASTIKGCVQPYEFLCLVDEYKFKELPKRTLTTSRSSFNNYCNVVFSESFPVLKSDKKTAGEMLLESMLLYKDDKHSNYLINNDNAYVSLGTADFTKRKEWVVDFLLKNNNFITIIDQNHGTKEFNTIISTLQYNQ